jgi:tyrosyl-tRNA synthetase
MYPDGSINVGNLLTEIGLAKSNSEAKRLIAQGAVNIGGQRIDYYIIPKIESGSIINVGKRRFAKVINTD